MNNNNLVIEKINNFAEYLLNNCSNDKKILIQNLLKNKDNNVKFNFIKKLRLDNDDENKTISIKKLVIENNIPIEIDENLNLYSQINEWINIFQLPNNNNVKNELKLYLNYFLSIKD